ncbi:MAG: pyridoxal-phosphate dependent enzyme [Candidatus Electryonea clarkiae]|nr:pyridoxal-phosphate dependent enzyme [Candidatus Electryonea clarkiae]MDP8287393.1 pyridoxal-phosphate dependent enzyme [Candidatus Electryonea clarkiae]
MIHEPTFSDIQDTHRKINPFINETPVLTSDKINDIYNGELFFKCENFQKSGSFKIRGATNAILNLAHDERINGVVTHSSGNFAGALSLAAKTQGIKAYVIMPENTRKIKIESVRNNEAEIIFCKPTLQAREEKSEEVINETGATFVHPYNNYNVIAGQGTAALELCKTITDLDVVISPVGGGGLISGTAITLSEKIPQATLIGAEPKGADDAYRSLKAGKIIPSENPDTIADGLLTSLGSRTFPVIQRTVSEIMLVSDEFIITAMQIIRKYLDIIVEPSAAITLGAILSKPNIFKNKRIGLILSGGNIDIDTFDNLIRSP